MADGRRHSVDVPISRALVALRRVRSLRDPSTNSLSKFSALFDNLDLGDGLPIDASLHFDAGPPKSLGDQLRESRDYDKDENCRNPEFKETICKDLSLIGEAATPSSSSVSDEVVGSDLGGNSQHRDEMDVRRCFTPASDRMDDGDSCNGPLTETSYGQRVDLKVSKWRNDFRTEFQASLKGADIESRVGNTAPFMNAELSDDDYDYQGCGLSYCWSRTPRFKSGSPSDGDDQPLLSGELGDTAHCVQGGSWTPNSELIPYPGSPRSLSQKFKPKTFKDLVGQNVVVRSLSQAIACGRLSSLYLFHGPRGTGKTSASRIFAAALNCNSSGEQKPCGYCQQCCLFFAGDHRDITFVDSVMISERERVRNLMGRAASPPRLSTFKVIVFDECQLLRKDAWACILNGLDSLPRHVVLIMISPDLDRLPRSAMSRSQRFHFLKIKDLDISCRLKTICTAEGIGFEQDALDFIAAKSGGSLRDAEMMLEQLSLVGTKISMSLAYEVTGIISDDELLELLDVALSPDTSYTVRMAREMMRSRIDPMQLTTQLANLIMDILAGKVQEDSSEVRKRFFENHSGDVDLQRLNQALKILSETEKQLRVSKNQSTWLTAALLQFSSLESNLDAVDFKGSMRAVGVTNGEFCSTPSTAVSLRHLVPCICDGSSSDTSRNVEKLELIWMRSIESSQPSSLRSFLKKHGRLSSICASKGVVVAELEFWSSKHVRRAENAWKLIASSLQSTLGCNVEIHINLSAGSHSTKSRKLIKGCFKFLGCYSKSHQKSHSTTVHSSRLSVSSDVTLEKAMIGENNSGFNLCYRAQAATTTIRDTQGNALWTELTEPSKKSLNHTTKEGDELNIDAVMGDWMDHAGPTDGGGEPKLHSSFPDKDTQPKSKSNLLRDSQAMCFPQKKPPLPVYKKASVLFCGKDPAFLCSGYDKFEEHDFVEESRKKSKVHCWNTPLHLKKVLHLRHPQQERQHSTRWGFPCTSTK